MAEVCEQMNPVNNHYGEKKFRIYDKETGETIVYLGEKMEFRGKFTMRIYFEKIKKDLFDTEVEWESM